MAEFSLDVSGIEKDVETSLEEEKSSLPNEQIKLIWIMLQKEKALQNHWKSLVFLQSTDPLRKTAC